MKSAKGRIIEMTRRRNDLVKMHAFQQEKRARRNPALTEAHRRSFGSSERISKNTACVCFYCLETFTGEAISQWWPVERKDGDDPQKPERKTAVCPFCNVDAVLDDQIGFELTEAFVKEIHDEFFGEPNWLFMEIVRASPYSVHVRRRRRK